MGKEIRVNDCERYNLCCCPLKSSNYRPISLLFALSRIAEKVMYEGIYKFLEKHAISYTLQFGLRASNFIKHALVSLTEAIKNWLEL